MPFLPPTVLAPPARYASADIVATIRFVDQDDVARACTAAGAKGQSMACTLPGVVIVMPSPQSWRGTPAVWLKLLDHELAHWNGWPTDHPR